MRPHAFLLVLLAGLGVCDAALEERRPAEAIGPAPAADAGAPPEQAAPSSETAVPVALLVLEGEGLRLIDPDSGSARPLPFGSPMPMTVQLRTRTFGAEPVEQGSNPECGAGPVDFVA